MFCYTGRTSVHLHWIKKLGINSSQILFLGWLDEPHEYIKKCAFLIDPFPWGCSDIAIPNHEPHHETDKKFLSANHQVNQQKYNPQKYNNTFSYNIAV